MGKGNDTLRLYEHGEEDFRNAMEDLQRYFRATTPGNSLRGSNWPGRIMSAATTRWWPCTERGRKRSKRDVPGA